MNDMPDLVYQSLATWFGFPQGELYAQVATSINDCPHLRTMMLYEITSENNLVFLSRTDTQKWQNLSRNSKVAVCFANPDKGQILVEGIVTLKTMQNYPTEIKNYWNNLPPNVKEIYLYDKNLDANEIPESFGAIFIKPYFWEVLKLCRPDYIKSVRKQFHLRDETWVMQEVDPS